MSLFYKNSFNSGDLITMLPGMQSLYRETGQKATIYQRLNMPAYYYDDAKHPVRDENGVQVCMNEATFSMMKPLLEGQEYVESYEIWQGEKTDFDFDLTRHSSQIPLPGGTIHAWPTLIFPQLECDLSKPWITVSKKDCKHFSWEAYEGYIVINRTTRYNNPYIDYFFLKEHQDKIVFAGTGAEHKLFCEQFKLEIPLLIVKNFLELAQSIASCRFFVGNQSLCWHISDSMKQKRILEVCAAYPNSFPTGKDGYSFVTQPGLEYRFNQLLKETE